MRCGGRWKITSGQSERDTSETCSQMILHAPSE